MDMGGRKVPIIGVENRLDQQFMGTSMVLMRKGLGKSVLTPTRMHHWRRKAEALPDEILGDKVRAYYPNPRFGVRKGQ